MSEPRATKTAPWPSKPQGLLLLLFKFPVLLYRVHLGWILGSRFLLLAHKGRKSGRARRTVLEIIGYDPSTAERLTISAYGEQADWYRNIRVNPACKVQTGRACFTPQLRFPGPSETREILLRYENEHPVYLRKLLRILGIRYDGSEAMRERLLERFRLVGFRPPSPGNES